MENKWVIWSKDDGNCGSFITKEEAQTELDRLIKENPEDDYSDCEVRELKKFTIDRWIHAHFCTKVDAVDFEEAQKIAEYGEDDTSEITFDDLDIGDSGISCIYDEEGNEYWCE